jgi:Protein of unknown function (DUF2934)
MAKRPTRPTTPKTSRASETADTYETNLNRTAHQADDRGNPEGFDTQARSLTSEPSEDEIRVRAYRRYLERGGSHGHDIEDWVEAERELKRVGA